MLPRKQQKKVFSYPEIKEHSEHKAHNSRMINKNSLHLKYRLSIKSLVYLYFWNLRERKKTKTKPFLRGYWNPYQTSNHFCKLNGLRERKREKRRKGKRKRRKVNEEKEGKEKKKEKEKKDRNSNA